MGITHISAQLQRHHLVQMKSVQGQKKALYFLEVQLLEEFMYYVVRNRTNMLDAGPRYQNSFANGVTG